MKNKDNSDENSHSIFFLEIVFINVEAGLLLNIPRHDDEKAKSPPTAQIPNKKDFADTNDNSTANVCRSATQIPNKKDFDVKYIRG